MEEQPLHFQKVRKGAYAPTRDKDSAGYDLKAPAPYTIKSKTTGVIPMGLAFDIPKGQYGRLATKSQQAWEYSLLVLGGVVDPGYTREVFAILHVLGEKDFDVDKGKDFIQLILEKNITPPLKEIEQLTPSVKKIKQYGTHVQKPTKRLIQVQPTRRTTFYQHTKKYRLRGGKFKRQIVKTTCKHCG